jgi:DNA-binding MarR family transcriptional regulator
MPPARSPKQAAEALAAVAPLASRWIERLLAENRPALTVAQYLALRAIRRERISAGDLALRAGVSGPAVSQLISGLAKDGLIERQPATEDRRRQTLSLSGDGARTLAAVERLLAARLGSLLGGLPRPEVDALSRALPQVEAALSGANPPRRPSPRARKHPKPHGPHRKR